MGAANMGRFGFSKWSWKRALGITAARQRMAKITGIPTTQAGRQRKVGRVLSTWLWPAAFSFSAARRVEHDWDDDDDDLLDHPNVQPPATQQATAVEIVVAGCVIIVGMVLMLVVLPITVIVSIGYVASKSVSPSQSQRATTAKPSAIPNIRRSVAPQKIIAPVVAEVAEQPITKIDRSKSVTEADPAISRASMLRTHWQTKTGKFSVEADLVQFDGYFVTLRRRDNQKEIRIEEAKLCIDDRNYLRHLRAFGGLDSDGRPK